MQQNLLLTFNQFVLDWLALFGIIVSRYFLICGGTHLLFYFILLKSRRQPLRWKTIKKDMELSLLCAVIFAFCAALVITGYDLGFTRLYTSIDKYGLWYLGVSFIALLIFQDAYFYFMHRLFHHPSLFKKLHYGHHRSGEPTPWTSFAFDPLEALVQALFFICIIFVLPIHYIPLLAALMVMTVWAVFNHIGFDLFPPSFYSNWLGKWFIGSKHHLIHHRKYTLHYGLYLTFWDKLLGTQDSNYDNERLISIKKQV